MLDQCDFHMRDQKPHETIDQYFAELQVLYESSNFGFDQMKCQGCDEYCGHGKVMKEITLRDRLIFGLHSKKIREKVLEVPLKELTLEKAYQVMQAMESSQVTMEDLSQQGKEVDWIERSTKKRNLEKATEINQLASRTEQYQNLG